MVIKAEELSVATQNQPLVRNCSKQDVVCFHLGWHIAADCTRGGLLAVYGTLHHTSRPPEVLVPLGLVGEDTGIWRKVFFQVSQRPFPTVLCLTCPYPAAVF